MPHPWTPPGKAWLAVLLLLTVALAGCSHEPPADGDGEPTAELGDFVRVHYVARFQDNGTVLRSSLPGGWPGNASLDEVDPDPTQLWVYMWHQALASQTTGRAALQNVAFEDLDADGFRESFFTVTEDILRSEEGTTSRQNRTVRLFDVPVEVTGDPNLVLRGLFQALTGTQEGQVLDDVVVPPEMAFGPHDPNRINEVPRLTQVRDRLLADRNRSNVESQSNLTEETQEGDIIWVNLTADAVVDARVTHINATHVSLYLLIEEGMMIPFRDAWNQTAVQVTNDTFRFRHDPTVGERYTLPQGSFEVVGLNATTMRIDTNHPFAGETLVYDIRVLDVVKADYQALLRGEMGDPYVGGAELTDVGFLSPSVVVLASDLGIHLSLNSQAFSIRIGQSWFNYATNFTGERVELTEVARDTHGEIWAYLPDRGLMQTTDSGLTWEAVGDGLPEGSSVMALAQSPAEPDVLFAMVRDEGIYRSDDRGASFQSVPGNLTRARALAASAVDADVLWAATGTGLRRSDDGGRTWAIDAFEGEDVGDVGVVDNDTRYTLVNGGFNKTEDDGATWQPAVRHRGILSDVIHSPGARPLYFATNTTGGIFLSFDGGQIFAVLRA